MTSSIWKILLFEWNIIIWQRTAELKYINMQLVRRPRDAPPAPRVLSNDGPTPYKLFNESHSSQIPKF